MTNELKKLNIIRLAAKKFYVENLNNENIETSEVAHALGIWQDTEKQCKAIKKAIKKAA